METVDRAIQLLGLGHNILITGGAGTGKSYTLRKLLKWADEENKNMARTALTGMASLQFEMGETLHRCTGIGMGKSKDDLRGIVNSWRFRNETRWELAVIDVLIVDEISMLRSDTLELIDELLKYVNGNKEPFGGLQVIFSGDFMQLPPIVKPEERALFNNRGQWAFQSDVWNELDLKIIYLEEIKRQKDKRFSMALNMIRAGAINEAVDSYFFNTYKNQPPEGIEPVKLLSTNDEVNRVNSKRLEKIDQKLETYKATITGLNDKLKDKIRRDTSAMETLDLKPGAQVMILNNSPNREFVNGSMGEYLEMAEVEIEELGEMVKRKVAVVRVLESDTIVYIPKHDWKIEKKDDKGNRTTLASFVQFPIKLGWAITVHKSQGMTIDYLQVDLTRCFAEGMAYVALSRARNYEGLNIVNWRAGAVRCNKEAFQFYMDLKNKGEI